jgi:glycosyltransferase involved in cell wall biosynthesis
MEEILSGRRSGISRDSEKFIDIFQKMDFEIVRHENIGTLTNSTRKVKMLLACLGIRFKIEGGPYDLYWQQQISPKMYSTKDLKFGNSVVRVHDLFPITNPEWFTIWGRIYFYLGWNSARKNSIFICNSNSTRKILLSLDPSLSKRSFVIPCPTTHLSDLDLKKCKCQGCHFEISSPYYLAVGTIEPRKNYSAIINSFNRMNQEDKSSKLVIVGKYGWKQSKIYKYLTSSKKNLNIVYIEDCCDSALKVLFQKSSAFISASLDEGFNISAAEARSAGIPLILSDIPAHQEFHRDHAFFFNPSEIDEIWQIRFENLSAPSDVPLDSIEKDIVNFRRILGTFRAEA